MANDLLKYGAIGVLLFGGYRYWRAYKVGSNLDIEISGVMANAISKNNFSIGVNLDVTNKSTERITLSNSNLKCYINGRYVGVAKVPYTQIINASTTTKVFVVVDVFCCELLSILLLMCSIKKCLRNGGTCLCSWQLLSNLQLQDH